MTVAEIVTTFNRPKMIAAALDSVFAQTDRDFTLILLDDGSNDEARAAQESALRRGGVVGNPNFSQHGPHGETLTWIAAGDVPKVIWWQGRRRSMEERREKIPYSCTINYALNYLLTDEQYLMYLCDDDVATPNSIKDRADFLDASPDVHVCYGRLRSIQPEADGSFNKWASAGAPEPATADFPIPTGHVEYLHNGQASRVYYENGGTDPDTGLPFVESALWRPGFYQYGEAGRVDHMQPAVRRECLMTCRRWPDGAQLGGVQYWGEDVRWSVGDAAHLTLLAEAHQFYGIDAWVASKVYSNRSWGNPDTEKRE